MDLGEEPHQGEITKPSIEILKESPPQENISLPKTAEIPPESSAEITVIKEKPDQNSCEVQAEKLSEVKTVEDVTINEVKNDPTTEVKVKEDSEETLKLKEKNVLKNRSDIFSLNENKNLPSTIFSVSGAPAKTIRKCFNTNMCSSNDTIQTNGSQQSQFRNPLTGIGVCSKDEFKNKPTKRKDGNPLLGVGYKDDAEFFSPPPSRIPPGGFSKGLW